ncbi:MAG: beta-ketoacyl-ACP synthase [Clostridia bacterium]|nr:beta-ketoacyl-ACP synthase [Clostridia bacterium]
MNRVAVTGLGIVSSIGHNVSEFKHSLKNGRCGIRSMEHDSSKVAASKILGALIHDFSFNDILEHYSEFDGALVSRLKACLKRATVGMKYAAVSAAEAWTSAGLKSENITPERIGIVVAGSNLSCALQYNLHNNFVTSPEYLSPSYALQFMDTDYVGTLSEVFNIKGEGFTVGGASASGNVGIIKACQLIRLKIVDVCLVIGSCADLSPMEIQGFVNLGGMGGNVFAEKPLEACRPFDKEHEGFIYGQASACLVLESIEHARTREAEILSYISGGAIALDANRLSTPCEDGEARAMTGALGEAGLKITDIDYINAHGTSTPLGDITEVNAIKKVFGSRTGEVWINSTKGLTGHCLYSAGVVEAIAVIIQMKENFLHPNLNLYTPIDNECRFCNRQIVEAEVRTALSNSFGFGGINTSVVIEKGEQPQERKR